MAVRTVERPGVLESTAGLERLFGAAARTRPAHRYEPPVLAETETRDDHPGDGEGRDQHEVSDRNEHRYQRQRPAGAKAGQGAGCPAAGTLNDDDGPGARGRRPERRE